MSYPQCVHGETQQLLWITDLCNWPDPTPGLEGFTRYYDLEQPGGSDAWVATIAPSGNYLLMTNRWSWAHAQVWFRSPSNNANAIEISVTPFGETTLNSFEPMSTYEQQYPTAGAQEDYRMRVALGSMVEMQLQVYTSGIPDPLSPMQIRAAEQRQEVPTVLQGLNRTALADILKRDPVATMENPSS